MNILIHYWPVILGVSGSVGAFTKFYLDSLKIEESKLKIDELKHKLNDRNSTIQRATTEEIQKYSKPLKSSGNPYFSFALPALLITIIVVYTNNILEPEFEEKTQVTNEKSVHLSFQRLVADNSYDEKIKANKLVSIFRNAYLSSYKSLSMMPMNSVIENIAIDETNKIKVLFSIDHIKIHAVYKTEYSPKVVVFIPVVVDIIKIPANNEIY